MKRTIMILGLILFVTIPALAQGQWTALNTKAKDLATGAGSLWLTTMDGGIVYSTATEWRSVNTGGRQFVLIDVDANGAIWAVDNQWNVFQATGGGWIGRGTSTSINIDPKGSAWVRRDYNVIERFDGTQFVNTGIVAYAATTNAAGDVSLIGNDEYFHIAGRVSSGPTKAVDFDLDGQGLPWFVGKDRGVYRWINNSFVRLPDVPGGASRIAVDNANTAFVVGGDSMVYMMTTGSGTASGSANNAQPQAQPQGQNRAPFAPNLLGPPNTYQPSVITNPGQRIPSVTLSWRLNGDPDGDPVKSWLNIVWFNPVTQAWQEIFAGEVAGTSYVLTFQNGLVNQGHYSWTVAALDYGRPNPQCTYSSWSCFHATLAWE